VRHVRAPLENQDVECENLRLRQLPYKVWQVSLVAVERSDYSWRNMIKLGKGMWTHLQFRYSSFLGRRLHPGLNSSLVIDLGFHKFLEGIQVIAVLSRNDFHILMFHDRRLNEIGCHQSSLF
jgi:hypothetical protein